MLNVTHNINEVLRFTDRLNSNYRFAVAAALTDAVKAAQQAMPAALEKDLDSPTTFTKSGFYIQPARKDRLVAVLGVKARQADYLRYQIDGGTRQPKRKALRLPTAVELDAFGNMPAGVIRQLVARAKAGRTVTKRQGERFGLSQRVELFYGDPQDSRPPGIYKRVPIGAGASRLVPLVVFPAQPARYEQRFDFPGAARAAVLKTFAPALRRRWEQALASSR